VGFGEAPRTTHAIVAGVEECVIRSGTAEEERIVKREPRQRSKSPRRRRGRLLELSIIAIAALTFGCHGVEGAAPGTRLRPEASGQAAIQMNSVGIVDRSLQPWGGGNEMTRGKIAVESTNSRRTLAGTLEVYAVLRNRTNEDLQIEGRSMFFDEAQLEAEQPTAWKRVFLGASSTVTYRESSLRTNGIAYYYIELREGR
jgi:hypothetical protein